MHGLAGYVQHFAILLQMRNCCALAVVSCLAACASADTATGTGNGGAIPPGAPLAASGTFTSDAILNAGGTVASGNAVTVILKGLQHGWSGDLTATLSYIDSQGNTIQSANLFYRLSQTSNQPEGSWAGFGAPGPTGDNYLFNSDFPGGISALATGLGFAESIPGQQTDAINGGQYFTSDAGGVKNGLSYAFAGLNIAGGTWRLTITDAADHASEGGTISNVGSLVGWEIDIQTDNGPAPDFTVTANPTAQAVTPGNSIAYVVTVSPVNGFSGAANLTVSGLPPDASGTFSPGTVSISGSTANSTLTIFTSSDTPAGSYAFTISAQAGSLIRSTTAALAVVTTTSGPLMFVPLTPCRIADTRALSGPFGGPEITGQTSRDFAIPNSGCGIPSNAAAYSLNVTVVPDGQLGYLTLWAAGQPQPYVSTLNSDGRIKANAAIIPAGANGAISVYASDATQLILDINGYFIAGGGLAFYPLPPCRVIDTRQGSGPLSGGTSQAFSISGFCNVPSNAQAYSLNFTAVPKNTLGYLTAWPAGQDQPNVSTLNALIGTVTANAAILPAGVNGNISVFATDDTDLVIDINGYFAGAGNGGLSLYTLVPCRALDTRNAAGSQPFTGTVDVDPNASGCGLLAAAQAYIVNATAIPDGPLTYLSLWADGQPEPFVSTLNAFDGAITSNMAIVPTANGSIDAFASNATDLILDLSGYFAP